MSQATQLSSTDYPVRIVRVVCALAGKPNYLEDLERNLRSAGIVKAVVDHNTPKLFEWLVEAMSYQGISDTIAADYMARHGRATWRAVEAGLAADPACPKLGSYWGFHGCGYRKGSRTCAEPQHLTGCPLPKLPLRNGNLNQLAYSLFLFIRDMMDGDLVGWLDTRLEEADHGSEQVRIAAMREAVLGPLRYVYGVSDKVLSVALSMLLLGGGRDRPRWCETGGAMIGIDTLVHNFLARTGTLKRFNAAHPYGPACIGLAAARPSSKTSQAPLMPGNSIVPSRRVSHDSCRARSGATALATGSTSATAIGSMMLGVVGTIIVISIGVAIGFRRTDNL